MRTRRCLFSVSMGTIDDELIIKLMSFWMIKEHEQQVGSRQPPTRENKT